MLATEAARSRRRGLSRALAELHYRLRTEGGTPLNDAFSVGLGVAIGCLPLYGLHLALTAGCASLFRLGRIKCYLAAHLNNPFTAPFLLYLELGVGHWLMRGAWPSIRPAELRSIGALGLGRDLALGSVVVGAGLGAVLGTFTWCLASRLWRSTAFDRMVERASRRYLESGISHWEFVRAKLRHDPVYRELIEPGRLPQCGRLVDLGCGRGGLLALVDAARTSSRSEGDGSAELDLELIGVDRRTSALRVARAALAGRAEFVCADLADYSPPSATALTLIDVLHYLPRQLQENLLRRAAAALAPGGRLIVREADASAGWGFVTICIAERLRAIGRGNLRQQFTYRPAAAWRSALEALGLETEEREMGRGTPFGNRLIIGRKRVGPSPRQTLSGTATWSVGGRTSFSVRPAPPSW